MKKYKEIFKNKYVVMGIVAILIIVLVQTSYAFFVVNFRGEKEITIGTKGFKFTYVESNALTIDEEAIQSDANGKISNKYFDFEVKYQDQNNRTVDYYIYLEIDEGSTLGKEKVKVYLTNQSNTQIVAPEKISNLLDYSEVTNSKELYRTSITSNGSETVQKYRLRLWIEESYETSGVGSIITNGNSQTIGGEDTTFKFKVGVSTIENEAPEEVTTDAGCFTYTTDASEATITGYKCFEGNTYSMPVVTDLVIPDTLGGKPVTVIADSSTYGKMFKGITSVKFPKMITTIGAYAFREENLGGLISLSFEGLENLTIIGNGSFMNNQITGTLILPPNLTTIGGHSFSTNNITNVEIPSTVTSIGSYAFNKNDLTGTLTIPKNVTLLSIGAFQNNKLTGVIFEEGSQLTTIGSHIFYSNELEGTLIIPKSVLTIGESLFGNSCNVTSIIFEEGSQLTTIGQFAFSECDLTGSITIPSNVTTIGWGALGSSYSKGNKNLTNVINTTGRSFNWSDIFDDDDSWGGNVFVVGTLTLYFPTYRTVTITAN